MSSDVFEEPGEGEAAGAEANTLSVAWREVPSLIAEQVVGHAIAGSMHRFVMAEVVFNPELGAQRPTLRPNVSLAIPHAVLPEIIYAMQRAYDRIEEQVAAELAKHDGAE